MEPKSPRRLSALVAASPRTTASASANALGKYHGKQIAQYKIWGHDPDTGKPVALGGFHKTIVSATRSTKGSVTTRAVSLGTHAKANVDGGFAADYQYEGGGTVRY